MIWTLVWTLIVRLAYVVRFCEAKAQHVYWWIAEGDENEQKIIYRMKSSTGSSTG